MTIESASNVVPFPKKKQETVPLDIGETVTHFVEYITTEKHDHQQLRRYMSEYFIITVSISDRPYKEIISIENSRECAMDAWAALPVFLLQANNVADDNWIKLISTVTFDLLSRISNVESKAHIIRHQPAFRIVAKKHNGLAVTYCMQIRPRV